MSRTCLPSHGRRIDELARSATTIRRSLALLPLGVGTPHRSQTRGGREDAAGGDGAAGGWG